MCAVSDNHNPNLDDYCYPDNIIPTSTHASQMSAYEAERASLQGIIKYPGVLVALGAQPLNMTPIFLTML